VRSITIAPKSGRVISIPRDEVAAISVGPLQKLDRALLSSPHLLDELRRLVPRPRASAAATSAARGTAATSIEQLCPSALPPGAITGGTPVPPDIAASLAAQFRPILRFDSREEWRPLNIEALFAERYPGRAPSGHRLCAGDLELQASCRSVSDAAAIGAVLAGAGPETYLDISGDTASEYCAPALCATQGLRDCDSCEASAIYYNVTRAGGRFYVDYWWFFRFNYVAPFRTSSACKGRRASVCFDHEGDWEGVTVVTSANDPPTLELVGFAEHEGTFRFLSRNLEIVGDRPVVYVARGTHATYPQACERTDRKFSSSQCRQAHRILKTVARPEGRFDGKEPWGRNDSAQCARGQPCLLPLPGGASWNAWQGHWGSCEVRRRKCTLATAPRSPRFQTRFEQPWCFLFNGRRECDITVPGGK
jgi:hypothetical protein